MYTKIAIFTLISALLVAVFYSSSTSLVFADISCIDFDEKTKICASTSDGNMYNCVKQDDGKWKCTKIPEEANVPPGLTDALEDVTAATVPNDGKILSENEDTAENDNMTFSRANISALD
jgi:hypothetical protein